MGLQIRDDRQMKALTGLSQAQFDSLLPIFSDVYQTTQQKSYEDGVKFGTRRRQPGGGVKGKLPTMAEKNVDLSSIITRPILPLMCSGSSLRWRAQKPMKTCISSHQFFTIRWYISDLCPGASLRNTGGVESGFARGR